jgi:hypothetical protein
MDDGEPKLYAVGVQISCGLHAEGPQKDALCGTATASGRGISQAEAIEVFEPATAAGPVIKRPHGAGLPDRHFMALAELRGRVAPQPSTA